MDSDAPAATSPLSGRAAATIVVVGATGIVGRELLTLLDERGIPASRLRALASARSIGSTVPYGRGLLAVGPAEAYQFAPGELVFLCADTQTSLRLAPRALEAGATVIDNSSAFRLDPAVPLIVPEINGHLLDSPPSGATPGRLIANPNCSTIILLLALEPLRRAFGLRAIDVATYQAVSGAGAAAIDELLSQTRAVLDGKPPEPRFFAEPCAFNLFSHESSIDLDDGVSGEERKIIDESRKITGDRGLRITPTCVRVPILRAHTQAITATLAQPATEAQIRDAYTRAGPISGLDLLDDRAAACFPTPRKATGQDRVLVGRLRRDPGDPTPARESDPSARWCLLASGDQLRKGAALNAVQIAGRLGLLPLSAHATPQTSTDTPALPVLIATPAARPRHVSV